MLPIKNGIDNLPEYECRQSAGSCTDNSRNTVDPAQNKQTISRTMLMKRHQRIAPLFEESF